MPIFEVPILTRTFPGTTAHFLRIAPHTVITLVANELILEQYKKWKHEK
jgi:solute carrier family 25 protein 34/35